MDLHHGFHGNHCNTLDATLKQVNEHPIFNSVVARQQLLNLIFILHYSI